MTPESIRPGIPSVNESIAAVERLQLLESLHAAALKEIERLQSELSQRLPTRHERDQIKALQAEVERLKADIARRDSDLARLDMDKVLEPTIELLESVRSNSAISDEVWIALAEPVKQELARIKAIVEKGTE